ncbi:molybdopterin-dependent oxidoreductase, partial [bacterium]|nr:molybdopterin-dependent oxidoreductase [bacterium]
PVIGKKSSDWPETIKALAESVRNVMANHGGDEIAVCISPRLTNEEIYLIQKFARVVLKTNNIFSLSTEINPGHVFTDIHSTASYPDIEESDALLIYGADLPANHRVADFMVRRSRRHGGKLVYIASTENKSSRKADVFLKVKSGTDSIAVMGLMKLIVDLIGTEGVTQKKYLTALKKLAIRDVLKETGLKKADLMAAAQILVDADKPVVISEKDHVGTRDVNDMSLLADLSGLIDGGLALFSEFNNAQGLQDMGGTGDYLGGGQSINDEEACEAFQKAWITDLGELPKPSRSFLKGLKAKQWKSVFIFGEDLPQTSITGVKNATDLLKKVEFLMVADIFKTKTMAMANIMLPLCTSAETNGTFTNSMGTINIVQKAIEPVTGMENWEMILQLVKELDLRYKFNYGCIEDIQDEIEELIPVYFGNDWDETEVSELFNPDRITLAPKKSKTKSIRPTNCVWTWFDSYFAAVK